MPKPICFDLTHLVSRLGIPAPSGIDKVDLAYGRHFAGRGAPGVHYGLRKPHTISPASAGQIIDQTERVHWEGKGEHGDAVFNRLRRALTGSAAQDASAPTKPVAQRLPSSAWRIARLRVLDDGGGVPEGAIYLNAAQHLLVFPRFFSWLRGRPDVRAAFVLHDLLPLDYPEYFRAGESAVFDKCLAVPFAHGKAFIVTSEAVRERIQHELDRRRIGGVRLHVQPLPSSLGELDRAELTDAILASVPYFVVLGTIEPRKNHLLLLHIWRQMAQAAMRTGSAVPKLVIVGARGWENEQVLDILDRSWTTQPHVLEGAGLSNLGLAKLVSNARALLMPSFSEGYGLPLVEALSLGTPVVATDAPVFREVTQGAAIYRDPIDGVGWRDVIGRLASEPEMLAEARDMAKQFRPPTWPSYFGNVESFLRGI
jgi:glycosyltransferase involved in cell wall biosynthesis